MKIVSNYLKVSLSLWNSIVTDLSLFWHLDKKYKQTAKECHKQWSGEWLLERKKFAAS